MTPEQRYLFDVRGYLHLKGVLSVEELESCREATARYIDAPDADLLPGFEHQGWLHSHGFAFDKCLEKLPLHPGIFPIVCALTQNRPRLLRGSLIADYPRTQDSKLHCAREGFGWASNRYSVRNGEIFCDDLVVFPYFDDVHPGDGGLVVVPGSHKAEFPRPDGLFYENLVTDEVPEGVVNVTPKAGDVVIISELLTHGTMPWQPTDRFRRALVLRFRPQHSGDSDSIPEEIQGHLSAETVELIATASFNHVKEIAKPFEAP